MLDFMFFCLDWILKMAFIYTIYAHTHTQPRTQAGTFLLYTAFVWRREEIMEFYGVSLSSYEERIMSQHSTARRGRRSGGLQQVWGGGGVQLTCILRFPSLPFSSLRPAVNIHTRSMYLSIYTRDVYVGLGKRPHGLFYRLDLSMHASLRFIC